MQQSIIILDFGSQYTQLIARRIREAGVYSEIYAYSQDLEKIRELNPAGIILSGGPSSVLEEGAPMIDPMIFDWEIPILGICYGMQLITLLLKGQVEQSHNREYGKAILNIETRHNRFFKGVAQDSVVWMSHGDSVVHYPKGFEIIARTGDGTVAGIENSEKNIYAVQFHPEVVHSAEGSKIISNFLFEICRAEKNWNMENFVENEISKLKKQCTGKKVVLGVSGGVDSTTLAVLTARALGDGVTSVFVNNGLLRLNEAEEVLQSLREQLGLNVEFVDASERFLEALKGKKSPEEKRKIIGKNFIDVFFNSLPDFDYLVQGTLYPDVIESASVKGPSQTIKTHHNRVKEVQQLEKEGRVLEPFRFLFKDEVREVARILGIPEDILGRHPFPGPGLAVRVIGDIQEKKLDILRRADDIFMRGLKDSGWYDRTWQAFAVYLPVNSVGVMGDERAYGKVIALRAITSVDGMTANFAHIPYEILEDIGNRIIREVKEVNRVVYDVTSKPPATIEWE